MSDKGDGILSEKSWPFFGGRVPSTFRRRLRKLPRMTYLSTFVIAITSIKQ